MFGRVPRLPADLSPKLEREERVLAWARAEESAIVVTNRGLWLPGVDTRVGWHEIHKAAWNEGVLTVTGAVFTDAAPPVAADESPAGTDPDDVPEADSVEIDSVEIDPVATEPVPVGAGYTFATDATPIRVRIAEPDAVPRRVRERVNASVAFTSLYPVPGGGAARVVARRVSGRDGLRWSVRMEGAAVKNQDHPDVRAAVDDLVADAKASISVVD